MKLIPLKKMAFVWVALMCAYVLLLTLAYAIPSGWINDNVQSALNQYREEGDFAQYFFGYPYGQVDNKTDTTMFELIGTSDANPLVAAMVPSYARYWHGYAVVLRPLSVFLNIVNLRYLNMFWMGTLFCLLFWMSAHKLGLPMAFAAMTGLLASFILIAPFCFQFSTVYTLTMLFCLLVLGLYDRARFCANLPVWFLAFGSLTHFFDFLTFPMLTLAYPLVLTLALRQRDSLPARRSFGSEFRFLLLASVSWCVGYGFTLLGKGLVGSLILGINEFTDIFSNVVYRVSGVMPLGFKEPLTAWTAIRYNLGVFFNARTLAVTVAGLLFFGGAALRSHKAAAQRRSALPVLGVALYPYVWYGVLQNHSNIHFFYTNKLQAATVLAVFAYLIVVTDWPRLKQTRLAQKIMTGDSACVPESQTGNPPSAGMNAPETEKACQKDTFGNKANSDAPRPESV